ncbi:MAG TPA: 50S ribosomal protein L18 [Bacteroidota bacterium]|nr:50S ribosomal protein L18 [Bacteroidota bacterium]
MITKKKTEHRSRLKVHIRLRISGTTERPRLTVFRSLKNVYAQIIDDSTGKTLVAVSNLSKPEKDQFRELKGQAAKAKLVGKLAAQKAIEKKITQVVFDRNGYLYHGVVKAMADGAREGGLKF